MKIGRETGITLIELMIVVSIVAVLVVTLGFEFRGWMGKYKVESQIKQMHIDFMNARARAMQRNRFHIITLAANTYTIYEDMNENAVPDVAEKLSTYPKRIEHTITWDGTGNTITFNTRGLMIPPTRTVRIISDADPDYDCMVLLDTKTNMGKWDGTICKIK
jgi:Tfp pilus assembly protein FimT